MAYLPATTLDDPDGCSWRVNYHSQEINPLLLLFRIFLLFPMFMADSTINNYRHHHHRAS